MDLVEMKNLLDVSAPTYSSVFYCLSVVYFACVGWGLTLIPGDEECMFNLFISCWL